MGRGRSRAAAAAAGPGLGGVGGHTHGHRPRQGPRPPSPRGAPGGGGSGASPGVLELDESEGRAPAAVLEVDVADGPVFVKDVLDVLGADVGGQVPHVDAAVVVAGWAADHAPSGHGKVSNGCGGGGAGAGRAGGRAGAGPVRAHGSAHTAAPNNRFKMATAAPLAVLLRAAISPRDAAPPARTASQAAPAPSAAQSRLRSAHARHREKVVPPRSPLYRCARGAESALAAQLLSAGAQRARFSRESSAALGGGGGGGEKAIRVRGFDGGKPCGVTSGAASAPRRPGRGRGGRVPRCTAAALGAKARGASHNALRGGAGGGGGCGAAGMAAGMAARPAPLRSTAGRRQGGGRRGESGGCGGTGCPRSPDGWERGREGRRLRAGTGGASPR